MNGAALALVAVPVLLGALTQRATGLGFALVGAPFLVAATDVHTGVTLSNALSGLLCLIVLARTWRRTRWREVTLLVVAAAVTVPLGALVVARLPEGPLLMLVGALAVLAVAVVAASGGRLQLRGPGGALTAGALSGFMNATAGVGGPMVSAYGLSQRWERAEFVPSAQACLLLINAGSLAAKGLPDLSPVAWVVCAAALVAGAVGGEWLDRRIGPTAGRRLIIVVALAGALAVLARGFASL